MLGRFQVCHFTPSSITASFLLTMPQLVRSMGKEQCKILANLLSNVEGSFHWNSATGFWDVFLWCSKCGCQGLSLQLSPFHKNPKNNVTRYDKMQVKVDGIGTLTVATFLALIVTGSVFGVWNFPDFSYLHADLHAIRYADTLMHDMHESDMASDTISLCILSILWEFVMWHFEVVCEWRSWKYFSSRGRHLFFTMIFGHARISHFL